VSHAGAGVQPGRRLLMGWLADRYTKKYVMLLSICSLLSNSAAILCCGARTDYCLCNHLRIGLGGDYMIIPLMAAELFGVKVMGRLMGWF